MHTIILEIYIYRSHRIRDRSVVLKLGGFASTKISLKIIGRQAFVMPKSHRYFCCTDCKHKI